MFTTCKLENVSGEVLRIHENEFDIDEIFVIEDNKRDSWANNVDIISNIVNGLIVVHNETGPIININDQINHLKNIGISKIHIIDENRDRSGKLRVHQTSRKLGTVILWTGVGDDHSDPSSVGGGELLSFVYTAGQSNPLTKYVDFNVVENETWLHEGYITWDGCYLDTLDLKVVSIVTPTVTTSGTNYNLYGGYLVVPAIPGTGTIDITSDITTATGGLVFMPNNDLGEASTAYWNAEWDTTTKRFINISAAPLGNGEYNMFAVEVDLAHFVRNMPLLNSGFIALNSSDTDELGHGMRLKIIANTNTAIDIGDHDWAVACTMCLHRAKTL